MNAHRAHDATLNVDQNWVLHPSSLGLPAESTTDRGVGMPRKRALPAHNCHIGRGLPKLTLCDDRLARL